MEDILACAKCKKKFGNKGLPSLYERTESDAGGYYPAHIRCEQCSVDGPGRTNNEAAIKAWNALQRKRGMTSKDRAARYHTELCFRF